MAPVPPYLKKMRDSIIFFGAEIKNDGFIHFFPNKKDRDSAYECAKEIRLEPVSETERGETLDISFKLPASWQFELQSGNISTFEEMHAKMVCNWSAFVYGVPPWMTNGGIT